MGKISGFMDYGREDMSKDPVPQRIQNYKEFEKPLHDPRVETQAARCMDCGVPYCSWGCPVDNLIPEFNDFVYRGQWEQAYKTLATTNNFPEFTGRVCPAPCEPACCATIVESPITIKHIELAIIEKAFKNGWVKPRRISGRTGVKIAVVGSGPAGLAAAQQLNLYGHTVTVFEKQDRFGGLLTYGIPDFKLEKWVVERRLDIMRQEEIQFVNNTSIGTDYPVDKLKQDFDYIALCCGAQEHRDLEIEGRSKKGIHFAMEYLTQQNKRNFGEHFNPESLIDAADKHVIVIGGGDTGSDCVGTAVRQKAKSVTQIQLHKTPPEDHGNNPAWPYMPKVLKNSASHDEGCTRLFSMLAKEAHGGERIEMLELHQLQWPEGEIKSGQRNYTILPETRQMPCDLLLIAMGFRHTFHDRLIKDLALETDKRGNVKTDEHFRTSARNFYACGDMTEGANLVVTAIASGRKMAQAMNRIIASEYKATA